MAAFGYSTGTFIVLTIFLVTISSHHTTAAPVHEDDIKSEQSQVGEYIGEESTSCYYNFQHYEEGDRIITNEPCLNCTCHKRMLMCYLRVCPFSKAIGQDCKVEKRPDQCCPVITCSEVPVQLLTSSTTPEPTTSPNAVGHLDDHGCTLGDSTFYPDGAQVPQDPKKPCELCYCIRNRTACVMQECTLNVEGCRPVYQDGVCCPVRYDCDYDETPTTERATTGGLILTTTPSPLGCNYNNEMYNDGELIVTKTQKPCEHCYCMRGDIVCAVRSCGTPLQGKDCEPVEPPEGECCPTTYQCPNGTVPLDSMSLVADNTFGLKPEDSASLPETKPEVDSAQDGQETDKIHDTVLNNQQAIETPVLSLFEHDETEKPEKLPAVDTSTSDKKESEPQVQETPEGEVKPQTPDSVDKASQSPDSSEIQQQAPSDKVESDLVEENESDVVPAVQDDTKPSDDKIAPSDEKQESVVSIPEDVTPVHDGIQQIHIGQIGDALATEEPSKDVNLVTSAPQPQDAIEVVQLEEKPVDEIATDESKPSSHESDKPQSAPAAELETSTTDLQETPEQVPAVVKPVEDKTNVNVESTEEQSTNAGLPEADLSVTVQDTKESTNTEVSQESGTEKEKVDSTGDSGSNEIVKEKETQQVDDQLQKKPNEANQIESENKPDETAQVQPSNAEGIVESGTQEADQVQQAPEEKPIAESTPEESTTAGQAESNQNIDQETNVKESSNEEETSDATSTQNPEVKPDDSVSASNESGTEKVSTDSDGNKDPTVQSQDEVKPTDDHENKLHDSTPQETNQDENKPEGVHDGVVLSDDGPQPTELSKPEEEKTQDSVTEKFTNEVEEKPQETVGPTEAQIKPLDVKKPEDDVKIPESDSVQTDEPEKKPLDAADSENNKESEGGPSSNENTSSVEDANKPTDSGNKDNVLLQTPEVGNQEIENPDTKPISESDKPATITEGPILQDQDGPVAPQVQTLGDSVDSEINQDKKPTKDSNKPTLTTDSDSKPAEDTKIPNEQVPTSTDSENAKPSETLEAQNAQEQVTPTKENDQTEQQPTIQSEEEPTKQSEEEPTKQSEEEPTKQSEEEPTKQSEEEPTKQSEEESTKQSEEEPTKQSEEEPTKQSEEEPTKQSEEEPTKQPEEEPTKQSEEEPTKQSEEEPTKQSEEEPNKQSEQPTVQPAEQPSVQLEDTKPSVSNDLPVQADEIEEEPQSPQPTPVVQEGTLKPEEEKESPDTDIGSEVNTAEKVSEPVTESKPAEESSAPSSDKGIAQKPQESVQPQVPVITSDASNDDENKLPETIQSEDQTSVEENRPTESDVSPNEVPSSISESHPNEDSSQEQNSPTNTVNTPENGEKQQTNELSPEKPGAVESGNDVSVPSIQEKPVQSDNTEENQSEDSSADKQEESTSGTAPIESNEPVQPSNEEAATPTVSMAGSTDNDKQSETPLSTDVPVKTPTESDSSETVVEADVNNILPVLQDEIESLETDEEEEPIVPENSPVAGKPSLEVEEGNKVELKPEESDTETKAPQSDLQTSNTKVESIAENQPASNEPAIKKPENEKPTSTDETVPTKDENIQDVQTPIAVEDNKNQETLTTDSPTTNEITNDHKITFDTDTGHGGVVPDLKETEPTVLGPVGIVDQDGIPGEGSCLVEGKTYNNNSNVPSSNVCHRECKCISSVVHCFGIPCSPPPPDMENCMPIKQGDSCCPSYACDANVTPVSLEAQNQMGSEGSPETEQRPEQEQKPESVVDPQTSDEPKTPEEEQKPEPAVVATDTSDDSKPAQEQKPEPAVIPPTSDEPKKPEEEQKPKPAVVAPETSDESKPEQEQKPEPVVVPPTSDEPKKPEEEQKPEPAIVVPETSDESKPEQEQKPEPVVVPPTSDEPKKPEEQKPEPAVVVPETSDESKQEQEQKPEPVVVPPTSDEPKKPEEQKPEPAVVVPETSDESKPEQEQKPEPVVVPPTSDEPKKPEEQKPEPAVVVPETSDESKKPVQEQKPELVDVVPVTSDELNKPEVSLEDNVDSQTPVLSEGTESLAPAQPSVTSASEPNIAQDEVNVPDAENESPVQVPNEVLPTEEEKIVGENVAPVDETNPQLPSDNAQPTDTTLLADNKQPSDNIQPPTFAEQTPSVESDKISPSTSVQQENVQTEQLPENQIPIKISVNSDDSSYTSLSQNELSSVTNPSVTEQDEKVNSLEGVTPESTLNKDTIPELPSKQETVEEQNPVASVDENPTEGQHIPSDVNEQTTSVNVDSVAGPTKPVKTAAEVPQNVDGQVNNLSDTPEKVVPQETPASGGEENIDSQEPSGTAAPIGGEQSSVESVDQPTKEQVSPEKEVISETSSQDKLAVSDTPNESITSSTPVQEGVAQNQTIDESESVTSNPPSTDIGQPVVQVTKEEDKLTFPSTADDTTIQVDEPENSDLEHLPPVFDVVLPNAQEEAGQVNPSEDPIKPVEVESSDKISPTVSVAQEEIATIVPVSDSKEQNTTNGSTESVDEKEPVQKVPSEEPIKAVESSDEQSSTVTTLTGDALVTPLSDNNEPNSVDETVEPVNDVKESSNKKTEDPIKTEEPSAVPDSPESSPAILPSDNTQTTEQDNVVKDPINTKPSEDPSNDEKPTQDLPKVPESEEIATSVPPTDNKTPNIGDSIESGNTVQESAVSGSSDPEKGTESSLVSEVNTELNNEGVKITPPEPSSVNSEDSKPDEESASNIAETPVRGDEIVSGTVTGSEALVTDAPSQSPSDDENAETETKPSDEKLVNPEVNNVLATVSKTNISDTTESVESKPLENSEGDSQTLIPADSEKPIVSKIDSAIIMDQKTESPKVSETSTAEQPLAPAEGVANESDQPQTSSPLDSAPLDTATTTVETEQPTVEVKKPVENVDIPAVQSVELPEKSDVSEITTQGDEKESTSATDTQQPIKEGIPSQVGTENENEESAVSQENIPVKSDSTVEETKPSEGSPLGVNVSSPSSDQIEGENEKGSESPVSETASPVSTDEINQPSSSESGDVVTKSPEILDEKDKTSTAPDSESNVDAASPINVKPSTEEASSDDQLNKVVPTDEIELSPPKESEPSPVETTENNLTDTTDVKLPAEDIKPLNESEISTPVKTVSSESQVTGAPSGESDGTETGNTESIVTEKPVVSDSSASSDTTSAELSPSTDVKSPSETLPEKDANENLAETPDSSSGVQEEGSSTVQSTVEENLPTENSLLASSQNASDIKPGLHQTVIAETSSVHASSSPKLPEYEEQKPESPIIESDDDKITFPEVNDDSISTSAPPSLISQEALNELASGQHVIPQKPALSNLPAYYPGGDSSFGPLPMPGWTPKPYQPETSSEESNTDEEEEHPSEGDMDYGGSEDGAFGPGTCRYGGKVYVSAQQIPRDDPCDFCFCFRSDIICLQQSCPPPIHRCRQESIKGFCCPRYECPVSMATTVNLTTTTTTTTTTLPPHFFAHAYKGAARRTGCVVKGASYQVGDEIKSASGPCLQCICGADGQMQCEPKICSPEPMLRKMMEAAVSRRRR